MPHYISSINRVKLLFIETTLSKIQFNIAAENYFIIQQPWHYGLNITTLMKILIQKVQQHGS